MPHTSTPTILVVDDDISIRESLELLILSAGWNPVLFSSASELLASSRCAGPCCLILDVTLPDLSGLDLQERIAAERSEMPIIFLTGHGDIPITVKAMKRGALEFLTKPFDTDVLLNAIRHAIKRSEVTLSRESAMHALREGFNSLTRREREVMALVVSGLLNKQVAGELGISEITVKAHRGNVMRKMNAESFADLVTMGARLRVIRSSSPIAA
jgi:FixJ family two-component response regulator